MLVLRLVVSTTLLLAYAQQIHAQPADSSKVDRALRASLHAGGQETLTAIITVNAGCRDAVRQALARHGDVAESDHPIIDAITARMHSADVRELAKSPCVRALSADATVIATQGPVKPPTPPKKSAANDAKLQPSQTLTSTLRDTLGLPHYAALDPSMPTGAGGIGVAVIDSGIAPSEDFGSRITAFYDFTRGGRAAAPYDDYGHGTHIAGLIGSSGRLSNYEFQGVAPEVRFVGLKVLDRQGSGRTSDVIRAIEFVIANRVRLNVQIVNLSLGHPIFAPAADDPLVQAVERASASGLIVVTSAGNFGQKESDGTVGYAGITSPGNAPSSITVGAAMTKDTVIRTDDEVAPYSSRGPSWFDGYAKPDLVAPGHRLASDTNLSSYLYSLLDRNRGESRSGQPLLLLSGSSMAAAVTSGVAALVLEAHNQNGFHHQRAVTPNLVKGILEYTAIRLAGADYLTQGAGGLNAAGAIALSRAIDTSRPAGAAWLGSVEPLSTIGGATYFWSAHVIYGDRVLSGRVLDSNNIVWSSTVVWGTSDAEGDNVVWGTSSIEDDNIVWGTNVVWGSNIVWSTRVIGQRLDGTNIVWGAQIVWGALELDNIVWGTMTESEQIVWGTMTEGDNVVWGTRVIR